MHLSDWELQRRGCSAGKRPPIVLCDAQLCDLPAVCNQFRAMLITSLHVNLLLSTPTVDARTCIVIPQNNAAAVTDGLQWVDAV